MMAEYTFKMKEKCRTVEAEGFDEALREAGINEGEVYEIMEITCYRNHGLTSSNTWEMLIHS